MNIRWYFGYSLILKTIHLNKINKISDLSWFLNIMFDIISNYHNKVGIHTNILFYRLSALPGSVDVYQSPRSGGWSHQAGHVPEVRTQEALVCKSQFFFTCLVRTNWFVSDESSAYSAHSEWQWVHPMGKVKKFDFFVSIPNFYPATLSFSALLPLLCLAAKRKWLGLWMTSYKYSKINLFL